MKMISLFVAVIWPLALAGRDRVVLSSHALLLDSEDQIRLETLGAEPAQFAVFPPLPGVRFESHDIRGRKRGLFAEYRLPKLAMPRERIEALPDEAAVLQSTNAPNAMDESVWTDAGVWRITVPAAWRQRDTLLRIHVVGDVARLYAGGALVADKFYNGQPFDFALWRIPPGQLDTLELRVMPLHPERAARLPAAMRPKPPLSSPCAEVTRIEGLERRQLQLALHGSAWSRTQ